MKKKVLAMLLALTMVGGLVSGCGKTSNKKASTETTETAKATDSTESASTETDSTESKYGSKSDAGKYVDSDTVGEDTLKKAGWVKLSSNGLSFYAPKECNTYANDSGNSSICIVGLNEDLYDKGDENTVIYGATDLYAVCKIDASGTFKSDKDTDSKDSTSEKADSTETEDSRVAIKNGVFTKGETEDLIKTVLNDDSVKTKVFLDNDEMIIYQLDGCSAYLGFIYGTTDLIEIIFDPAAYKDIYEIKAQIGEASTDSTDSTESTESTESSSQKLTTVKGKTGYLSEQYLDQYKSANAKGKVGKVAYKAGYFMDGEKEAALVKTLSRISKESSNK